RAGRRPRASARCRAHGRPPGALRRSLLAIVAAAREHPPLLAREELLQVGLGDLLELQPELAGYLRDIPEHVAELPGDRPAALVGDQAAVVADRLLGVLGDLPGLAGEAEGGVGEPRLAGVLRGAPRELLVSGERGAAVVRVGPVRATPRGPALPGARGRAR